MLAVAWTPPGGSIRNRASIAGQHLLLSLDACHANNYTLAGLKKSRADLLARCLVIAMRDRSCTLGRLTCHRLVAGLMRDHMARHILDLLLISRKLAQVWWA